MNGDTLHDWVLWLHYLLSLLAGLHSRPESSVADNFHRGHSTYDVINRHGQIVR
jgi:hypothetical protein